MNLDEFSKRLKHLMELEGVSNRALSIKIDVDRTSIRFWLSGKYYPRYDALMKLSAFFKVRIDSLLGIEEVIEDENFSPLEADFKEKAQYKFFEKVNGFMEEETLTKYALAKELDIDQKALTNWFTKGSMPETTTIIRLAKVMHVSIDELLGRKV